jgi:hypothetical protein
MTRIKRIRSRHVTPIAWGVLAMAGALGATSTFVEYPEIAVQGGIDGWVDLAYELDAQCELHVEVLASDPEGIFEDVARRNWLRMMVVETEEVDWGSVPNVAKSDDRIMSQAEYNLIRATVDAAGPWPRLRVVRTPHDWGVAVTCRLTADGHVLSIDRSIVSADDRHSGEAQEATRLLKGTGRLEFKLESGEGASRE